MEQDQNKEGWDHYAVRVEHMTPTKIWCKCGAIFQGNDAVDLMKLHMQSHDAMADLERTLKMRNVFDLGKDDIDEESP